MTQNAKDLGSRMLASTIKPWIYRGTSDGSTR